VLPHELHRSDEAEKLLRAAISMTRRAGVTTRRRGLPPLMSRPRRGKHVRADVADDSAFDAVQHDIDLSYTAARRWLFITFIMRWQMLCVDEADMLFIEFSILADIEERRRCAPDDIAELLICRAVELFDTYMMRFAR
jgi:hypothetical protein